MIEPTLYVAPRGETDGDIGGELPVATPEVVGRIDELLHRRPEVIGELRPFDDDADLVVESAHPVGRPHDVVFGDRGVEDTLIPKLLEHALGDIEDTALVPIGDILPPEEGVGIVTELLLQRLIQSLYQRGYPCRTYPLDKPLR